MVEVKNLSKSFKLRKKKLFEESTYIQAVHDVSFSIKKGETMGFVGESGSGKTTAARSILRLIKPDSGKITIGNREISSLSKKELRTARKNIQIVFQDPYSSLNPRQTIGKIISEPLKIHTLLTKEEREKKVKELLDLVGLDDSHYNRYPHEFSGGQRQRIGIARAIAVNPDFIVLDEPVSALDVSIQGQILNLLKELQQKLDLTYLFVSHDLSVVKYISDTIAVMYLGRIVEMDTKEGLFSNPKHPYTISLLGSIPKLEVKKHGFSVIKGEIPSPENPPTGCHFHPRCVHAMDICKTKYPETKTINGKTIACHLA